MVTALNIPFVSESYDRLMEAQRAYVKPGLVDPIDTPEKLRAARNELGMTQAALGDKVALSGTFIGLMERGANPIEPRTDLSVRYLLVEHRA
jgi:DNA-binding XRE family transcriptional regulator